MTTISLSNAVCHISIVRVRCPSQAKFTLRSCAWVIGKPVLAHSQNQNASYLQHCSIRGSLAPARTQVVAGLQFPRTATVVELGQRTPPVTEVTTASATELKTRRPQVSLYIYIYSDFQLKVCTTFPIPSSICRSTRYPSVSYNSPWPSELTEIANLCYPS